MKLTFRYSMI